MSWRGQTTALGVLLVLAFPAIAAADAAGSHVRRPPSFRRPSRATAPAPVTETQRTRRAPGWITDFEDAGPTQNCITQLGEPLGSAWTGWYGDIGVSPQKNQVYYVQVGWGIAGNPCTGGAGVHAEIVLPAYTQLAISNQNRVRCFYDGLKPDPAQRVHAQDCPQNPQSGLYGGYSFDPPGNQ